MILRRTLILFLTVFVCACGDSESPQESQAEAAASLEQERAAALSEVEEANRRINELLREGQFEEAGAYFAPDVIQFISGQPPIHGREQWIQAQRAAAELGEWNLDLEVLDFEYLGDMAVERGKGIQSLKAAEGSPVPSMEMTGNYMVLWKKTPEGWKIQYDYVVVEQPDPMEN